MEGIRNIILHFIGLTIILLKEYIIIHYIVNLTEDSLD